MMVIDDVEGLEQNKLYNLTDLYKEWFQTFKTNLDKSRKSFNPGPILERIQSDPKMVEIIGNIDVKEKYPLEYVITELWPKLQLLP